MVRPDIFCGHGVDRALEESGVLAVAALGRGHYGVFLGPDFRNFIQPGPQPRTFFLTEDPYIWGLPAFKVGPGLQHRAFLPNPDLLEAILKLVPQSYEEAAEFFSRPDSVPALRRLTESFAGRLGRYESYEERKERMWREIAWGKEELEQVLGHALDALCWPWGACCPEARALAEQAGFSLFFSTEPGVNPPGSPLAVHRFKSRNKSGAWLLSRVRIYSRPWLGAFYTRLR
jgi:hypothetical protein